MGRSVETYGRVVAMRTMKRSAFADLEYQDAKIQVRFTPRSESLPAIGDWIELTGKCFRTKSDEPTVDVEQVIETSPWRAEIAYVNIPSAVAGPMCCFTRQGYERLYYSQASRNVVRAYLVKNRFMEVQMPIVSPSYNGGRSFPVTSSYLSTTLGYNRATMEDRMEALIAAGFERIFQIGSVFRSDKEYCFVEGYSTFMTWQQGRELMKGLLSYAANGLMELGIGPRTRTVDLVCRHEWREVDFCSEAAGLFSVDRGVVESGGRALLAGVKERFSERIDGEPGG